MDWNLVSNIIAGGMPLIALNSYINKLVLENAISKTLLKIGEKYVTKDDFMRHIEQCPYALSLKQLVKKD